MLETGTIIGGRYRILSEIGRGGTSIVYLAVNDRANKMWAVKEFRRESAEDFDGVRKALLAETDMLAHLRHPRLPTVVDVLDEDDSFFIVMDYVEGRSLENVLKEEGPQPQERVREWGLQLCDVFVYLHSRQPPVIYRDLKPSNIILRPDGRLILIDFGTARRFQRQKSDDTLCLGTPGYAAPEQFPGRGQTDARTDIYGLGATMYYLLTGCEPGMPPYGMKLIRELRPDISAGLEAVVEKCTKPAPEERYQTAAALMYALAHYNEADASYRAVQKNRFMTFVLTCMSAFAACIAGICFQICGARQASTMYSDRMKQAAVTSDPDLKAGLYLDCISIPGKDSVSDAYIELIHTYRDSDSVLDRQETAELETLVSEHKEKLRTDMTAYVDVCFEMGKTIWYYYDYGSASDMSVARATASLGWFEEVVEYSPENYSNRGMAQVYAQTGIFYRDIALNITEASDKGLYSPFFDNLNELIYKVGENENEREIVRLQIFKLAFGALRQYAQGFRGDGVSYEAVSSLLERIGSDAERVSASSESTREVRNVILKGLPDARDAVNRIYSSRR